MKKIILVSLFMVTSIVAISYAKDEKKTKPLDHLDFLLLALNAEIILYYDDGAIRGKIPLKKGIREGVAHSYYPDGSKKSERYYVDGKIDGVSKGWHNNGKLRGTETLENGVRQGYRKSYYKSGKKRDVVLYKDGEPIIIQMYSKDGSTLYEKDYTKD